jgi:hypothetical protein
LASGLLPECPGDQNIIDRACRKREIEINANDYCKCYRISYIYDKSNNDISDLIVKAVKKRF